MKKFAITVLAAVVATVGMASVASADSRRGDEWKRHDRQSERHADRRNDNWRHGDRHHKWKRHHWRHGHNHGPRVVIRGHFRDDYCFVKKVRRYDDWGNVYIKRVRVCR